MKVSLKLSAVLLAAFMIITACSSNESGGDLNEETHSMRHGSDAQDAAAADVNERLIYIALGDSVSAGYGIHSDAYRHSDIFFNLLLSGGYANDYINMAIDGQTTTALLTHLNDLSPHKLELFSHASVITLNIGGNNILQPFLRNLPDMHELAYMLSETLDFIHEAEEVLSEIMYFINESRETIAEVLDFATDIMGVVNNFHVADVLRLREFIDRASVIDDAVVVFDAFTSLEADALSVFDRTSDLQLLSTFSLLMGDFPPLLEAELREGVLIFANDFTEIISWLKRNAPNAYIIVNTVYNPMPRDIFGFYLGLYSHAYEHIREINRIIIEKSINDRIIVSDIHSILSGNLGLMNINFDFVHPNPTGHSYIALRNFVDFMQHKSE